MEHGPFHVETAQDMIETAVAAGITPLVRVGELLYSLVARLLDVGAQGIVLPRVEDPGLLASALGWMRFPPEGNRGFGVIPPVVDFAQEPMPAIMEHLNRNTMAVVQFETAAALERAGELLAVKGVDVAMVGPADLSVSMGVPGRFSDAAMIEAIRGFIGQCERAGVVPGIRCRDAEQAEFWVRQGMRLVGAGGEHRLLLERARQVASGLRAAIREAGCAGAPARSC
ncbi:MAG: HpcH/HpaI aldolase family protein [Bryobacteraceae bacterium]